MNVGIASGFIRFGSLAHRILVIVHEHKRTSHRQIYTELKDQDSRLAHSKTAVNTNIGRLRDNGFLYVVGSSRGRMGRSFALYAITRRHKGSQDYVKPMTATERTRKYRARKAVKVPSVFAFRGQITVKEDRV